MLRDGVGILGNPISAFSTQPYMAISLSTIYGYRGDCSASKDESAKKLRLSRFLPEILRKAPLESKG